MRKMSQALRIECSNDPFFKKCCLTGESRAKIDWHHCFTYKGTQINERWNIMPVWSRMHSPNGLPESVHNCKDTKSYVEYLCLKRVDLKKLNKDYPRFDWEFYFRKLEKMYGEEKA